MRIRFSRPGEVLVHRRELPGQAHPAPHRVGLAHDVVAEDPRLAGVRTQQGRQHPNQRRLARAVWAEDAEDLARRDPKSTPSTATLSPNRRTSPCLYRRRPIPRRRAKSAALS